CPLATAFPSRCDLSFLWPSVTGSIASFPSSCSSALLPGAAFRFSVWRPKSKSRSRLIDIFFRCKRFTKTITVRKRRSISSTSLRSILDCLRRSMTASISAGSVFGISSPLAMGGLSLRHRIFTATTSATSLSYLPLTCHDFEREWLHFFRHILFCRKLTKIRQRQLSPSFETFRSLRKQVLSCPKAINSPSRADEHFIFK